VSHRLGKMNRPIIIIIGLALAACDVGPSIRAGITFPGLPESDDTATPDLGPDPMFAPEPGPAELLDLGAGDSWATGPGSESGESGSGPESGESGSGPEDGEDPGIPCIEHADCVALTTSCSHGKCGANGCEAVPYVDGLECAPASPCSSFACSAGECVGSPLDC
jgi:hypothetical protein